MSYIVQQPRSTEEGKRPRAEQLAEGQLAVNVNNASPGVFLRTTTDKVVKVGGTAVGPTTPFALYNNEYSIGELWYDTSVNELKIYDGQYFVNATSAVTNFSSFSANAPAGLLTLQAIATALGSDPARAANVDTRLQAIEDAATALTTTVTANDTAQTTANTTLQTTLQTAIDNEATTRGNADTALSGRLDTLEADSVTKTYVDNADTTTLGSANTYTDTEISGLVGTAPAGLNNLGKIANALDNDASFANSTQTALNLKADAADAALTGTPTAPTAAGGTNTTQIATTEFVTSAVNDLVDAAPGALDTLNELAAALGDDANFATTITNSIAAVQADVDQNETDADNAILELDTNQQDLVTLSGVAENATDLGTFTGDIITDNVDIKTAIQELESRAMHDDHVHLEVHNDSGGDLVAGDVVYVSGTHVSGTPNVQKADANGIGTYPAIGLVSEGGITNGAAGDITISGLITGLDTDTPAWDAGTALYVSETAGGLTSTRPTAAGTKVQKVALVARRHVSAGSIIVMGAGRTNDVPNELTALTGVALNDTDLGTFTGTTIADNETLKGALQDLEDGVELKLNSSAVSAFGLTLVDDADAATARTTLGLGNVDNTADADKPVSTATQTALDDKAPLASPALTGTPTAPTAAVNTNTTQVATTAFVVAEVSNELSDTNNASALRTALGITENAGDPADGRGMYYDTSASKYLLSS